MYRLATVTGDHLGFGQSGFRWSNKPIGCCRAAGSCGWTVSWMSTRPRSLGSANCKFQCSERDQRPKSPFSSSLYYVLCRWESVCGWFAPAAWTQFGISIPPPPSHGNAELGGGVVLLLQWRMIMRWMWERLKERRWYNWVGRSGVIQCCERAFTWQLDSNMYSSSWCGLTTPWLADEGQLRWTQVLQDWCEKKIPGIWKSWKQKALLGERKRSKWQRTLLQREKYFHILGES